MPIKSVRWKSSHSACRQWFERTDPDRAKTKLIPGDGDVVMLASARIGYSKMADGVALDFTTGLSCRPGDRIAGPAVIVELSATTFLPMGWSARTDGLGNMVLTAGSKFGSQRGGRY